MYYENSHVNRETWKYTYQGKDLYHKAKEIKERFRLLEMKARQTVAGLLSNPSIRQDDPELDKLRKDIIFNGKNYEALCVYENEFARNPDREFHLGLGDVVFFELCEQKNE